MDVFENTSINRYTIELDYNNQLCYDNIYILSLIKLKILKIYIEIYLKIRFILPFKSPTCGDILYDKKLDDNFCLYVNFQDLNNLTIKNKYPFPLIGKLLNWLRYTKQFI